VTAPRRVALVSGFWGQNIGNAFFNVGGKWMLEQAFGPDDRVEFIQDQPGYRTFHDQSTGNPANDIGLLGHLAVDYIVLQGPMLTVDFRALWQSTFAALKARGTKIILLGAAMFRFTEEEVAANRAFLAEIEPHVLVTRDRPTFDAFKDLCEHAYAGLDSAFFVPYAYRPFDLDLPPYVAMTYDRFPEPAVVTVPEGERLPGRHDTTFTALGMHWGLDYPWLLEKLAHRGKVQSYVGSFLDRRALSSRIGGYQVVRPEHRFNPHVTPKIYKRANAVASDEPFTYFTVYANTELTVSDRVHACIVTLAYGRPAIMYRHTERALLFDRLDLHEIGTRPVELPRERLDQEMRAELEFLRTALGTG
jgi:hypothetical protein